MGVGDRRHPEENGLEELALSLGASATDILEKAGKKRKREGLRGRITTMWHQVPGLLGASGRLSK